jgi:DNA segregation ATPase FtsK/SpoIIIE-like protein
VAVALNWRYRVIGGWLARGRLRRRWDRACRMLWLSNLNDHTPRIRRLTTVPAGYRLDVTVPAAVGMADLERNADTLASTLQVQAVRVVRDRERADRASVTIVQRDPLLEPVPSWPLADTRQASVWEPVPVGIDEDGQPVTISLPYRNVLVGGEPGGGKSVAVSQLLAVAALDPTVDLWLLDGKRVELGVWRDVATAFVDTSLDDAIDVLHRLRAVIDQRLDWLDAQPGVRRKITRADGRRMQVLVCDEYAFYTTTGDRRQVKEFEAAFTDLVARGRAVGVVTILATQKPHSDVISTGLRDLFAFRWALRCTTPQASDTVLGQGWASRGYSAAELDPACPGVGWLLHERGLPLRCRTHYLDDEQVEQLAARAIVLRRANRRAEFRAG